MLGSASTLPLVRRIAGIVLAVSLIGGVVAAVVAGRDNGDKGTATKTVRGVISEHARTSGNTKAPRGTWPSRGVWVSV